MKTPFDIFMGWIGAPLIGVFTIVTLYLVYQRTGKIKLPYNFLDRMLTIAAMKNCKEFTMTPLSYDRLEVSFDDEIRTAACSVVMIRW